MLSTIDQHISALLFHHEIVVIPDFGAFITRRYPAELQSATGMLRPPSKRVAFNQRIKDNDGVLARYISKCENISYQEALESIAISVRSWERVLRSGKRVHLNGIGKLFMEDEGRIQFSPGLEVNYEIKAYGLSIFRSQALQRSVSVEQKVREVAQEAQAKAPDPSAKKPSAPRKEKVARLDVKPMLKWAAILIPIAALSIAGYLYQDEIENKMSNISTLSPLPILKSWGAKNGNASTSKNEDSSRIIDYNEATKIKKSKSSKPTDSKVQETAGTLEKTNATSTGKSESTSGKPEHQVVVGSFSSSRNARNYAQNLTKKGHKVVVKKHGSKSMFRVVILAQGTENQALLRIKQSVNGKAWLL